MPRGDPIFRHERIELDFKDVGLHDSVSSLGRLHMGEAHLPWDLANIKNHPKHRKSHEGIIEVHYLASGRQVFQVADREYRTRGGDLLVVLPGEEHGTGEHTWERMLIYWIRIQMPSRARGGKFLNLPKKFVKPMLDKLSGIRPESRVFRASTRIRGLFNDVILSHTHSEAPMKPLAVLAGLSGLMMEIVRCSQAGSAERKRGEITAVLKYIDEHIQDGVESASLGGEELSEVANLSRSQFQVKFRRQVGMSPAEYVTHRKIERAVKLLSSGRFSVTDVAFRLGFSSSQYFATVFKKYTNKHPRDYRVDKPVGAPM